MPQDDPWTIHYTELPPFRNGEALTVEWDFYRREAGNLLAQGHEGRWVMIKGEEVLGLFDSREAAMEEFYKRFPFPRPPILVHQVQTRERMIRFYRIM